MSLFEMGHSSGMISVLELLAGRQGKASDSGLTIPRLAEIIAVGGWPGNLGKTPTEAVAATIRGSDRHAEVRRAGPACR